MANRGARPLARALRVSLIGAAALFGANLYPMRSQIITSDEGIWEGSWRRDYGWPRRVYQEWGYDPSIKMHSWFEDGLVYNGRVILASSLMIFGATLAILYVSRCDSRFAIRDSSPRASVQTPSRSPSESAFPSRS